jgi:hypothetical protein
MEPEDLQSKLRTLLKSTDRLEISVNSIGCMSPTLQSTTCTTKAIRLTRTIPIGWVTCTQYHGVYASHPVSIDAERPLQQRRGGGGARSAAAASAMETRPGRSRWRGRRHEVKHDGATSARRRRRRAHGARPGARRLETTGGRSITENAAQVRGLVAGSVEVAALAARACCTLARARAGSVRQSGCA